MGPWKLRTGERRLILLLGDLAAAGAGMVVALVLWGRFDYLGPTLDFVQARAGWFLLLPLLWPLFMVNLYDLQRATSRRSTVQGVLFAAIAGTFVYLVLYFTSEGSLARRGMLYFLANTTAITLIWRWLYIRVFTAPNFLRRVLVIGARESGKSLLGVIQQLEPRPYNVVGLIDDDPSKRGKSVLGVKVLGNSQDLLGLVERESISDLIVAILGPMNGEMFQALLDAQERGIEITRMPVAYEELLGRVPVQYLESDWLLRSFVDEVKVSGFYLLAKRVMDLAGGALGLFLFVLALPVVSLATAIESGRPIFYRQRRLGQGGRTFQVIKVRTMRKDAEADGQAHWAKDDDPRATKVGRLLRRAHLDELPQMFNVLRGEMSLVGPRPERPELVSDLEKKIPFYRARLLTKPGVTGWAQINFGKGSSVEGSSEKLEYDLYYIKRRSLLFDLWIVLRTIGEVLGFRGV
jgi:exopolysaccharide biosynthesis polyprenyl glycosylphosphotransferase